MRSPPPAAWTVSPLSLRERTTESRVSAAHKTATAAIWRRTPRLMAVKQNVGEPAMISPITTCERVKRGPTQVDFVVLQHEMSAHFHHRGHLNLRAAALELMSYDIVFGGSHQLLQPTVHGCATYMRGKEMRAAHKALC